MAQTSTRRNSQAGRRTTGRSNGSGRSAASTRGSSSTRSRRQRNGSSGAKRRSSAAARSGSQTTTRSRRQTQRSSGSAGTSSVKQVASKGKDAAAEGVQGGGRAISTVAGKMKGPALAGGAALAGLAGGMAVQSKRDSGRKVLGMRLGSVGKAGKDLADVGQSVGRFTENLGEFAIEMRKTREAIDDRAKHRSPVEVVLQALTARR